ncbi:snurportin-1 [Prorops nasuta]|uniref:snurportin-1 n=1 Tax=Prorops nasuta TaxID=863751 RepID=UPI0034CF67AE
MFCKKPIKKYKYRLETDLDDTPQEIRRQRLLQSQKKSRDAAFNIGRGILEEAFNSEEEYEEEEMEIDKSNKWKWHTFKRHRNYANQLMLSEWMMEVPQDFLEKWTLVPCPQGRRTLVVACKGITKAYNRRGNRLGKFHSALPGGNPNEYKSSCTILDCIWFTKQKAYFVLDVLAWSNQPLTNCDTEFRFFWLKSKLSDITELQERSTYRNTFPMFLLPKINCNENLDEFLSSLTALPPLDGILFYHRDGYYAKGRTPLVTWLKPFMLSEILCISVPPFLGDKPEGYIDLRQYILSNALKKKKKKSEEDLMQVVDNVD